MINAENTSRCSIELKDVSLVYEMSYDKTNTLKERIINAFHRRKYFEAGPEKLFALKDINLKFNEGEKIGVIGLNGSGKSTLLKVISGVLKPSLGTLAVVGKIQPLIEIGAGFNPEFSGRENIYLNGYMLGFTPAEIREKEKEIIEFAELGHFIDIPIKYYSSGMAVRLAFTIATLIRPEILIFDEMLSAGDASFIDKAKKRMDTLLSSVKMLVLVSHDLNLIQSMASRTLVMDKGRVVFDGNSQDAVQYYFSQVVKTLGSEESVANPLVAGQIREEERMTNPQVADQIKDGQKSPIAIVSETSGKESFLISGVSSTDLTVYPKGFATFYLSFKILENFDEFFINLEIKDHSGLVACHLRNDYSDIQYKNLKPGDYKIEISVHDIPWKSGKYIYCFRLVGKIGNSLIICDSEPFSLTVLGDQTSHRIIRNEWRLNTIQLS